MQPPKVIFRILGFLVLAGVIYTLLIIPWPGLHDAYRSAFHQAGNVFLGSFGGDARVRFEPTGDPDRDTKLILRKERPFVMQGTTEIDAIQLGYRPTVFLIALIIATPVALRRRFAALFWGLIVVNLFVLSRVYLYLLSAFSDENPLAIHDPSPTIKTVLEALVTVLVRAPVPTFIVPILIWLLVTFRRSDVNNLLNAQPPQRAQQEHERRRNPKNTERR